jgi:ribonuclease HI
MAKSKFYVVWKGRQTGVFETWDECKAHIDGFAGAIYKSFKTREEAEGYFRGNSRNIIGKEVFKVALTAQQKQALGKPIEESISVDGAWNTGTGIVEYQGRRTDTRELLFHQGPFEDGTINIVEFLAIVHALAYCKQKNLNIPIYSDSRTAMSWVRRKQAATRHEPSERNRQLFEMLERAVKWLENNEYSNQILKWESKGWGENPADFGRK